MNPRPSREPRSRNGIPRRFQLRKILLLVLCVAPALPAPARAQAPDPLQGIEAFVDEGMSRWEIPGLAMAVVKDDTVVYAQGFGVLGLEDPRPVGPQTLFGIASVTKAFTAGALGMLVDEGLLDWDDPVTRHLPAFRLYDPWVTEQVTVRDLLTHRVGVGRLTGNRLLWLPSRPRSELVYRVRYLGPEQSFRNGYVYSNVMYTVAGELIPAVTGMSWDDFLETRLFPRLGMTTGNTSVTRIPEGADAALPHQEIEGRVVPIPRRNFDAAGPSASINAGVEELARWMRMHLGEPGVLDGERILSEEVVREMHRAQNRIPDGGPPGDLASYGLGFRIGYHEGVRTSSHGGATDGMNTTLVLVPELELGVVVVTNTFNSFMNALANRVLDRYMGIEDRDWISAYHDGYLRQRAAARAERDRIHADRQEGTSPSLPLEAYAGLYLDSLYADARVTREGDALVLTFWDDPLVRADLEHWHHDTFRAVWRNPAMREEFVRFTLGWDGGVDALHVEWVLRPQLLQVGAYPSSYTREARLERIREDEPLRIGATMSETGAWATQGIPARNGYLLCAETLNADGGLLGRTVEFVIHDDRSDPERARELYDRLLSEGNVDAILGPYGSTLTEAVAPVTEAHRQVHISPLAATSSIWEQGRTHLFMVLPPAELFLAGLIELAHDHGYDRVGILHEEALFPAAAARGAAELARERDMEVLFHEGYPSRTEDFAGVVTRVDSLDVEVLGVAASNLEDFVRLVRQMKADGVEVPLLGTSGAVAEFQEALGPDAEGVFGLSAWEPSLPHPGAADFAADYRERFGVEPSFHAAGAYGSCMLLAEAARAAGTLDSEALRRELLALETTTAFGPFAVDERGYQVANRGVFIQWQEGRKVVVWPEEFAAAEPRIGPR